MPPLWLRGGSGPNENFWGCEWKRALNEEEEEEVVEAEDETEDRGAWAEAEDAEVAYEEGDTTGEAVRGAVVTTSGGARPEAEEEAEEAGGGAEEAEVGVAAVGVVRRRASSCDGEGEAFVATPALARRVPPPAPAPAPAAVLALFADKRFAELRGLGEALGAALGAARLSGAGGESRRERVRPGASNRLAAELLGAFALVLPLPPLPPALGVYGVGVVKGAGGVTTRGVDAGPSDGVASTEEAVEEAAEEAVGDGSELDAAELTSEEVVVLSGDSFFGGGAGNQGWEKLGIPPDPKPSVELRSGVREPLPLPLPPPPPPTLPTLPPDGTRDTPGGADTGGA